MMTSFHDSQQTVSWWRRISQPSQCLPARTSPATCLGFTLVELMLTIAIIGILATIATASYGRYRDRVQLAEVILDIGHMQAAIANFAIENRGFPNTLNDIGKGGLRDPWGNPYEYLNHDNVRGNGPFRKDKNIVPINSDYDLYSAGKDGRSVPPLTARASRDDIVRANNGRFIGLASDYDP